MVQARLLRLRVAAGSVRSPRRLAAKYRVRRAVLRSEAAAAAIGTALRRLRFHNVATRTAIAVDRRVRSWTCVSRSRVARPMADIRVVATALRAMADHVRATADRVRVMVVRTALLAMAAVVTRPVVAEVMRRAVEADIRAEVVVDTRAAEVTRAEAIGKTSCCK